MVSRFRTVCASAVGTNCASGRCIGAVCVYNLKILWFIFTLNCVYVCVQLLDFSQQLCDKLEQMLLRCSSYNLLSLDEKEPQRCTLMQTNTCFCLRCVCTMKQDLGLSNVMLFKICTVLFQELGAQV